MGDEEHSDLFSTLIKYKIFSTKSTLLPDLHLRPHFLRRLQSPQVASPTKTS